MADDKFEYFKKLILNHLDGLEKKENRDKKEIKKALSFFEMSCLQKGGYPVGTIREWKGKKYIKIAPGKWRPKYDSNTRGAKNALTRIRHAIENAKTSEELIQIILANKGRFSDEKTGAPLDFVKDLFEYVSSRNDEIESGKTPIKQNKKFKIKNRKNKPSEKKEDSTEQQGYKPEVKAKVVKKLSGDYLESYKTAPDKLVIHQSNSGKNAGKYGGTAEEEQAREEILRNMKSKDGIYSVSRSTDSELKSDLKECLKDARTAKNEGEKLYWNDMADIIQKEIDSRAGKKSKEPEIKESDAEKHENRSRAMLGNKNAYKGGSKEEPKSMSFKSVEELQNFAKSTYGIDVSVKNKKDLEDVKKSFSQVEAFCNQIPGLNKYIEKVSYGKLGKNVGGDYEYISKEIRIGVLGDESENENFTFAQGNDSIEATTVHELTHVIQAMLVEDGREKNGRAVDKLNRANCKSIVDEALKNLGLNPKRKNQSINNVYNVDVKNGKRIFNNSEFNESERAILGVSLCAFADDPETVSECFADVMSNGEGAQPISKEIYKITMQRIKDRPSIEPPKTGADVAENHIDGIINNALRDKVSRQLLNSMVDSYIRAGGRSVNDFMFKYGIKTGNDILNYIEGALSKKNAGVENAETDDDFLKRIGIGKVAEEIKPSIDTIRNKYESSKSVDGWEDDITLPDGSSLSGNWKIVEADAPSASHDETTFRKTEGFPANENGSTINDRDYENDRAAQEGVMDIASDFDGRALDLGSPVVVSKDGVVISGNNRTMSSKLAAKKGTDKKYLAKLHDSKFLRKVGLNEKDLEGFKNPRLVFETDVNGKYSTDQFAKFNASGKKAQSSVEKAVKISKTIKPQTVENIADTINQFDTMGELYANKKACMDTFNTFITDGVIPKAELSQYYTEDGGISDTGKEFMETVLIGSIVNEGNIRQLSASGGKEIRQKLVRAIVPLVENKGMNGYSITKELNEAVSIALEVKKSDRWKNVEEFSKQNYLNPDDKPSEIGIGLAKKLEGTQREFAAFMKEINGGLKPNANGEPDIFLGKVETKDEVLNRYFNIKKSVWEILNSLIA